MANLVTAPRKWRKKVVLAKIEAAYNDDAVPTGAANWIEARNVSVTPLETEKVARNIELPYLGKSGEIIVGKFGKLSFDVALVGSGVAGTAPKWGPLMLAAGTAETTAVGVSVAYNLVSEVFGSVSLYINIAGTLHKFTGARGDVKGKVSAKGIPMASFSFEGLFTVPTEAGMPVVDRTGWPIEEGVNSANTLPITIDGTPLAFSDFEWGFGNKLGRIDLPGPQLEVLIDERAPTASVTVLAPALADFNPFALVESGEVIQISQTHGKTAGKKIKVDLQAKISGVEYDNIEGQVAYKLTLDPEPVAGNDEIVLTCL